MTQFETAVPRSRSLRRDALVLAAGMGVANAGNYGFNVVMAFLLGPEAYGALAALLALVLVGSVPGLALQAVVARRTALARPDGTGRAGRAEAGAAWPEAGGSWSGGRAEPGGTWPGVGWLVGRAGLGLVVLTVLAGPGLMLFLHLDSAVPVLWLALALAPTPLLFAVQGLLQGRERFGALAAVMVAGAAVKLAAGLALVAAGLGVSGAMAGVAAGGLLAALAGLRLAAPAIPGEASPGPVIDPASSPPWSPAPGAGTPAPSPPSPVTPGAVDNPAHPDPGSATPRAVDDLARADPGSATLPHRGTRHRGVGVRHARAEGPGAPAQGPGALAQGTGAPVQPTGALFRGARALSGPGAPTEAVGWWREVGTATTGLLGLFLLANVDVLLARHYLDRAAAGRYALGAVVAKIAFWAPQFVVTVIFPRLVGAADPRRLLGGSALLIAGFGGLLAGALALADRVGLVVPVLGGGYAGLGP
ncbi:MAG TPA: hypothetical protein VG411_12640, partial [Actinomycetota bacterium]|nr:hypothetical protein [Actinomycetota bacterium]